MSEAKQTRILLGVTGGIAAYKSPELVRQLVARGAEVQVVMTGSAREFVGAASLQAVSGHPVRSELFDEAAEAAMSHIELARWPDRVVIAPATADFIARLAGGFASDLLSTLCLATEARLIVAPAMNHVMWRNQAVQDNCARLKARGVRLIGPADGEQACGETGPGRMVEPVDIAEAVVGEPEWLAPRLLAGKRVVVTAGPTREPIDPVRYITNRSSGKMGYAVAAAAAEAGADVVLVSGPVALATPPGIRRISVETAEEMFSEATAVADGADIFIACAAVSDYRPPTVAADKIKRHAAEFDLHLVRSPDTLAAVAALPDGPLTVGFAAETTRLKEHALGKLESKRVDMIAANRVGRGLAFDQETNALSVFWHGGSAEIAEDSKLSVARQLIRLIAERHGRDAEGSGRTRIAAS